MKWNHKLVQIAFRNYNSYVYHDTFLQLLLIEEMAKVINLSKLPLKLSLIFQTKVENCNENFFAGIGIPFPDLSQTDLTFQVHELNCAFKYLSEFSNSCP